MCKQEDYFKKLIYMHNKNIFPCHASTGRPKPCRALGLSEGSALQDHVWLKTSVQTSS